MCGDDSASFMVAKIDQRERENGSLCASVRPSTRPAVVKLFGSFPALCLCGERENANSASRRDAVSVLTHTEQLPISSGLYQSDCVRCTGCVRCHCDSPAETLLAVEKISSLFLLCVSFEKVHCKFTNGTYCSNSELWHSDALGGVPVCVLHRHTRSLGMFLGVFGTVRTLSFRDCQLVSEQATC